MRWVMPLLLLASHGAPANMVDQSQRMSVDGIDVVTFKTSVKDVVVILGALPAGDAMAGPGNIAIPTLTGMMLDRGTRSLDKFAIADRLDSVGAQISFAVGTQSLEIRAKCLGKDLPLVMELIAAELRTPALQPQEFAKAKQQFIGSLEASLQHTEGRAQEAFGRAIYPEGHPNRPHSVSDFMAAAKAATLEEVKAFHAKYYGPAHMTLILAGDVPSAPAQAQVAKAFAGWTGGQDYIRPPESATVSGAAPAAPSAKSSAEREISVPLKGKASVSVLLGQATGLKYRDPDDLPLRVGTAIFGHGFTGRLMGTVRDREGLTYNIGASVLNDSIADGEWVISASFAPALLDRGIASTRRELLKWWSDGVTDAELADRKEGLIGGYFVGLSTTGGLAGALLTALQRGYDVSWLDQYPKVIAAMSRSEIDSAIKKHLDPASMVLVEAGSVGTAAEAPPTGAPRPKAD